MKRILFCLLACLLLTGCEALPFARELESTMLVQVLGVDWTRDYTRFLKGFSATLLFILLS